MEKKIKKIDIDKMKKIDIDELERIIKSSATEYDGVFADDALGSFSKIIETMMDDGVIMVEEDDKSKSGLKSLLESFGKKEEEKEEEDEEEEVMDILDIEKEFNLKRLKSVELRAKSSSGGKYWKVTSIDYTKNVFKVQYGSIGKVSGEYEYPTSDFYKKLKEKLKKEYEVYNVDTSLKKAKIEKVEEKQPIVPLSKSVQDLF